MAEACLVAIVLPVGTGCIVGWALFDCFDSWQVHARTASAAIASAARHHSRRTWQKVPTLPRCPRLPWHECDDATACPTISSSICPCRVDDEAAAGSCAGGKVRVPSLLRMSRRNFWQVCLFTFFLLVRYTQCATAQQCNSATGFLRFVLIWERQRSGCGPQLGVGIMRSAAIGLSARQSTEAEDAACIIACHMAVA